MLSKKNISQYNLKFLILSVYLLLLELTNSNETKRKFGLYDFGFQNVSFFPYYSSYKLVIGT